MTSEDNDHRLDLELELAQAANERVQRGEAALAARDQLIAGALDAGTPVVEVAKRLGISEQAIYQIRERLEGGAPTGGQHAATAGQLELLSDHRAFELAAVSLLQDLDPSLRHTGGSGDRAQDAVGGLRSDRDDSLVVMISLEAKWTQKIRREFERVARNDTSPSEVWAVTNRRTTPRSREALGKEAAAHGWRLRIFDQAWLASRLIRPEHLSLREQLLGLAPPQPPAFLESAEYRTLLARRRRLWPEFIGREDALLELQDKLEHSSCVILAGSGGVGKTRLALELSRRHPERWVFIDDHAMLDPQAINDIAGSEDLVAVIDNAHRRTDLRELIGLLERRQGELRVILITRPGYDEQLVDAVADTRIGPPTPAAQMDLRPLSPKSIAEILRGEPLSLTYRGAIEAIIDLSEGNPEIALLAGELSKKGTPVEAVSQGELLQIYVASLLASVAATPAGHDKRVIREILALTAALDGISRDDETLLGRVSELVELGRRGLLRVLADLADAGLLEELRRKYFVKPDLLAEHMLWATFFSDRWQPTIEYQEVWRAFAPTHLPALVRALGRLPAGAMARESPALRATRTDLVIRAETVDPRQIASVLAHAREIARGVPTLAADIIDIALGRLPGSGQARDSALRTACAATERVGDLSIGWGRQLAVAAAAFAEAADEQTTTAVTKALTSVYQRVPTDTSEHDAALLAGVQRMLAQLTLEYWNANREARGTAQAVAIASRTLLTVVFESTFTTAENPKSIVMASYALPGSPHTQAALSAGAELYCETFLLLPVQMQIQQLEGIAQLRRIAKGLPGPFNIEPSEDTRALALTALQRIEGWLRDSLPKLSLPVRAEAADMLETVTDPTVSEYVMVAHPRALRRRAQSWEDSQLDRAADVDSALRQLRDAESPTAHLDLWADWIRQGEAALGRRAFSPIIGMSLERAAETNPQEAGRWIKHLIDTESLLLANVTPALTVLFADEVSGGALAKDLASHSSPRVRALTARALQAASRERGLVEDLAADPDAEVRDAVLDGLRYSGALEEWRIDTALRATRDQNIAGVHLVLNLLERAAQDTGTKLTLTESQVERMCQITVASAADAHLQNAHELVSVFALLAPRRPRLAVEWVLARLDSIAQRDEELRDADLDTLLATHNEPIPPEILSQFADAAEEPELQALLQRFSEVPVGTVAFGELANLIAILDDGGEPVTSHIIRFLERNDEGEAYRAHKLLGNGVGWDAFTQRARTLLTQVEDPRLVESLIEVRDPTWWSGSVVPKYQALLDQYATWCDDSDAKLAFAGAQAVARYRRMIDAETAREAQEDDDWNWRRPAH
jgi:hypothetical protein